MDSNRLPLLKPLEKKPTILTTLRNCFITGLFVSLPLVATALFVWWADGFLRGFWPEHLRSKFFVSMLSLLMILAFIILMGAISKNLFGKQLLNFGEHLLSRIPIINSIYGTVKQVTTAFNSGTSAFKEVVLIRYPHFESWAIAFRTNDALETFNELTGEDLVAVFMPTTPNPTSGFLIYVPRKDIRVTKLTVDQAFKVIISTGMVNPGEFEDDENGEENA